MNDMLRRCLAMSSGAVLLAFVLLSAGVPGAVLVAIAPALLCVAMHLLMANGAPDGKDLLETAQRAARVQRP